MAVGIKIEIKSPVPDVQEIKSEVYQQIKDQMLDLNFDQKLDILSAIEIPELPSLPIPMFTDFSSYAEMLNQIPSGIQLMQDYLTVFTYLTTFSTTLSTPLQLLVSKIPNMDYFITDIIAGDVDKLFKQIDEIRSNPNKELPYNIPKSQYLCSSLPTERLEIAKQILCEYKKDLLQQSTGVMENIADYLQVELPTIPAIPDLNVDGIYKEIFNTLDIPAFEVLQKYNVDDLLGMIPIPIPPKINAENLTLFYSNTEKDLKEVIRLLVDYYSNIQFNVIVDIINNTFKSLGIEFPLLVFEI